MTITSLVSDEQKKILLTSKYWLIGAQYLGKDDSGNYIFKMYEMAIKKDNTSVVEETIRTINSDGKFIGIKEVQEQKKFLSNQVKLIDNELYELNNGEDEIQLVKVTKPNEDSLKRL